ncbi:MAG: hypothetical protein Q9225_004998, partial [Loekoesia sp. 1 TL-2023]
MMTWRLLLLLCLETVIAQGHDPEIAAAAAVATRGTAARDRLQGIADQETKIDPGLVRHQYIDAGLEHGSLTSPATSSPLLMQGPLLRLVNHMEEHQGLSPPPPRQQPRQQPRPSARAPAGAASMSPEDVKYVVEHPNFNPSYSFNANLAYLRRKDKNAAEVAAKKKKRKEKKSEAGKAKNQEVKVEEMTEAEEVDTGRQSSHTAADAPTTSFAHMTACMVALGEFTDEFMERSFEDRAQLQAQLVERVAAATNARNANDDNASRLAQIQVEETRQHLASLAQMQTDLLDGAARLFPSIMGLQRGFTTVDALQPALIQLEDSVRSRHRQRMLQASLGTSN